MVREEGDVTLPTLFEPADLVQAAAIGRTGEVLEMGGPVRIVDLARDLVAELDPGVDITIEYTGLRCGEKLHEVLVGPADRFTGNPHEGIDSYPVPALDPAIVEGIDADDIARLRSRLTWIIEAHSNPLAVLDELV